MRFRRRSPIWSTGLLLATLALAAGCDVSGSSAPTPNPAPPRSAPATPVASSSPSPAGLPTSVGVGGLDVRYLENGEIKTLRVEDFPR